MLATRAFHLKARAAIALFLLFPTSEPTDPYVTRTIKIFYPRLVLRNNLPLIRRL